MIISKTPLRISFFGGGTDYPNWYNKYGGEVISTSINKYIYITCRELFPFFKHNIRISYSIVEECKNINQIKHPSIREIFKMLKIKNNIEIHYDGDLPGKSGLGSSSSFIVGVLKSLYEYKNKKITKRNLLLNSLIIEHIKVGDIVGSQDQVSAVYGGFNLIKFKKNGEIKVNKINISKSKLKSLENNLMLFYTGILRSSQKITKSFNNKFEDNYDHLRNIRSITKEAVKVLSYGDIDDFGHLLNRSWIYKQKLSKLISNNTINSIYNEALKAGALGGKLLGAGGGGFVLLYVRQNDQKNVEKALSNYVRVPFKFENTGSEIIYNS